MAKNVRAQKLTWSGSLLVICPTETQASISSRQPSSLLPMTISAVWSSTRLGTPTTTRKQIMWLVRNTRGRRLKLDWQKLRQLLVRSDLQRTNCRSLPVFPYKLAKMYFQTSDTQFSFSIIYRFCTIRRRNFNEIRSPGRRFLVL